MQLPKDINEYLRARAPELGERILQTYPPLQGFRRCSFAARRTAPPQTVSCTAARNDGGGKALG